MPKLSELIESKFMKKSDIGDDEVVATIHDVQQKNVALQGQEAEHKWCVLFREFKKPLVLNSTNAKRIAKACESEDTDHWIGKRVILYVDEEVEFAGQTVGGIRIKPIKKNKVVQAAMREPGQDDDEPVYEADV